MADNVTEHLAEIRNDIGFLTEKGAIHRADPMVVDALNHIHAALVELDARTRD